MDIRNWAAAQIMQLPNSAFGTSWVVGMGALLGDVDPAFTLSSSGLPDKCVIYSVAVDCVGGALVTAGVQLALGDVVPTTDAQFNAMELLFGGVVSERGVRGQILGGSARAVSVVGFRTLIYPAGRRLVARFIRTNSTALGCAVYVVISAFPNEIPDFYAGSLTG